MTHVIGSGEMLTDLECENLISYSHDPIAYIYEADHHCPACTCKRFGRGADGFLASGARDREGNEVGVLAPWDEWQNFTGEPETLGCGTCGAVIETYTP